MSELKSRIIELRNSIRYPRDQKGDDRCWLDYRKPYSLIPEIDTSSFDKLPEYDYFMRICSAFYHQRRAERPEPLPTEIWLREEWDKDLKEASKSKLKNAMEELIETCLQHYRIPLLELNLTDDINLFRVLPEYEHVELDFTLPPEPEFLGTAKLCAGCPNFRRSHNNCGPSHIVDKWGPCI